MSTLEAIDVLIIGSGPAGMSTALHLVQADPAWAHRLLVIDKATHPREKLCGGGLTRPGTTILQQLGLSLPLPHIPIHELHLVLEDQSYIFHEDEPIFRVIRRDEFDHWLVCCGRERGITVREGELVTDIQPAADHVLVTTARGTIRAGVVVAADGSRSVVRQKLGWGRASGLARLLEVLTPEPNSNQVAFEKGVAVFDYSAVGQGLQGYYWDFPSLVQGQRVMNRGVYDSRRRPKRSRANLKALLREFLAQRQRRLADYQLKGHPIHWFSRQNRLDRSRIILVGDAAGVDPLVGEGISFALGYGPVAAAALNEAFARQDFRFANYRQRVLADPLLSELPIRTALARLIYALKTSWQMRLAWPLVGPVTWLLHRLAPRSIPFRSPVRERNGQRYPNRWIYGD